MSRFVGSSVTHLPLAKRTVVIRVARRVMETPIIAVSPPPDAPEVRPCHWHAAQNSPKKPLNSQYRRGKVCQAPFPNQAPPCHPLFP